MNQQQLQQKALTNEENKLLDKAFAYAAERGKGEKPETFTDSQIKVLHAFIDGAEWMQGEGERLRESIDIEQLIPELMDKRVEEVMREAFGKTTILDKTIYEGENAYYLSRKQIAEDLLDKFYIIPKPQTEQP